MVRCGVVWCGAERSGGCVAAVGNEVMVHVAPHVVLALNMLGELALLDAVEYVSLYRADEAPEGFVTSATARMPCLAHIYGPAGSLSDRLNKRFPMGAVAHAQCVSVHVYTHRVYISLA